MIVTMLKWFILSGNFYILVNVDKVARSLYVISDLSI